MPATVQFKLGNMFDGPSDMVVIPCSSAGTITAFVAHALDRFGIPWPQGSYNLGEVRFLPMNAANHVAQYAAVAASVRGMSSEQSAIREIGVALGQFASEH